MQANMQSLAKGMTMILQNLPLLFGRKNNDGAGQATANSSRDKATQTKSADDQWQKCGGKCS